MIRDWLFGSEEEQRPPKPEPKEKVTKHYYSKGVAYWPGSEGGTEVAWEGHKHDGQYSVIYRDWTLETEPVPHISGVEIQPPEDCVTIESMDTIAVYEESYTARPCWKEYFEQWRFNKDRETVEWERVG